MQMNKNDLDSQFMTKNKEITSNAPHRYVLLHIGDFEFEWVWFFRIPLVGDRGRKWNNKPLERKGVE